MHDKGQLKQFKGASMLGVTELIYNGVLPTDGLGF